MKKSIKCFMYFMSITSLYACSPGDGHSPVDENGIKAEIDKVLKIQENAYDERSEEGRRKLAATCDDSLLFVGGDNGGLATSANFYVHDLADGYSQSPHDKVYRIFGNTAIVTSVQQTFKIFNTDTIYFNSRYTKVFVKKENGWKMVYVTYAPLPVIYTKANYSDPKKFEDYTGLYEESPTVVDTLSVINGKVFMAVTGSRKAELLPVNDSTFLGEGYFGKTVFARNKTGKVTHCYFEFPDGQRLNFPRK